MKNRCRINYIAILTTLDLLISYNATKFSILPSVFPNHQFDRPHEL